MIKKEIEKPIDGKNGLELLSRYRGVIMGFAALWILYFHEWNMVSEPNTKLWNTGYFLKIIGFCGVDIFLMLSGIGLTYAIKKSSLPVFYYRRFKRVFLPFLIIGIIRCVYEKWGIDVFFKNVLCINFYSVNMYSFLWFVPAILSFYLVFPLFYKIFTKNPNLVTFFSLQLWLILTLYFRDSTRGDLFGFTNRIPIFIIGVYLGYMTQNKKPVFTKMTYLTLLFTFGLGLYLAYLSNYTGMYLLVPVSNCCLPNILISVSLPFLIAKLLYTLHNIKYVKYIEIGLSKVLKFFGGFSLELYCVQEFLAALILVKIPDYTPLSKNLIIFIAASAAGFVLYLAVKYFWKLVDFTAANLIKRFSVKAD